MSICATVGKPIITRLETCGHDGFVLFDRCEVNIELLYYILKFLEKNGRTMGKQDLR